MTHPSLTLEIPADMVGELRELVVRAGRDWDRHPTGVGDVASHGGVLPLSLDIGGVSALKLDGSVVTLGWEGPATQRPVTSARARDLALAAGARRYPILGRLLPTRDARSQTCPSCAGTGAHPLAAEFGVENLACSCGGLGWIPESWEPS